MFGTIFSSILLSLYMTSLFCFSFVTHPIGYCLLLLLGAICMISWVYVISGLVWYLLLFCLVYIGGVYILFVFISLQDPNPSPYSGGSIWVCFLMFVTLLVSRIGCGNIGSVFLYPDWSRYLCCGEEGWVYVFFCLVLVFGFFILSLVGSSKDSFFR